MTSDVDPECFEYYEIDTEKDGRRFIRFGSYIYNAECSMDDDLPELTWREVGEKFSLPLEKYLQMRDDHLSPWSSEECCNRPDDYIEDITEEDAKDRFIWYQEHFRRLDKEQIKIDTPDGGYIGIL